MHLRPAIITIYYNPICDSQELQATNPQTMKLACLGFGPKHAQLYAYDELMHQKMYASNLLTKTQTYIKTPGTEIMVHCSNKLSTTS